MNANVKWFATRLAAGLGMLVLMVVGVATVIAIFTFTPGVVWMVLGIVVAAVAIIGGLIAIGDGAIEEWQKCKKSTS